MLAPMSGPRVLVVSASMGGGHDMAAHELARRVRDGGGTAEVVDVLALGGPRRGPALRAFYRGMVRRAPAVYDAAMRAWQHHPRFFERVTSAGSRAYRRGLLGAVERTRPDVVVSTYNLGAQLLGRMRQAGELGVPVVSYVTDPGPHPYWVAPGVDRTLAVLPETAEGLEGYGAAAVDVVAPLVRPALRKPPDRRRARAAVGVPPDAHVPLISAGTWAVGAIEAAVGALAAPSGVVPLTLCGRHGALRRRLESRGHGIALGWTDDVATVFAAADVLVDNAGGLTCWEALVCGLPVVLHRPIPGHGRINARTLAGAGLATVADSPASLAEAARAARPSARARDLLAATAVEDLVRETAR
jgi:UDP-N-acetylglucosamine:LPS N-acetylglucosamine transferase